MRAPIELALAVLGALLVLATPSTLRAQPQTNVALAETLYQQGRDLVAAGRYDEACPKFEESYRLDPATGTLLNLASCHESQGKLATAWFEFMDGLTAARRDERPDRVEYAQTRLTALEPKLSRLTLVVPQAADHQGLELELDGTRIGRAARGVPTPVDPGTHIVEARAPGRKPWKSTVLIGTDAEQRTLSVPVLEPIETLPVVVPPPKQGEQAAPPAKSKPAERPIPTSAYATGAVTAGLLVGAVVTGVLYLDRHDRYETTGSSSDYDAAHTLGVANAILTVGTAVGAGLTTYFYVTRPEESRTNASAHKPGSRETGARFSMRF